MSVRVAFIWNPWNLPLQDRFREQISERTSSCFEISNNPSKTKPSKRFLQVRKQDPLLLHWFDRWYSACNCSKMSCEQLKLCTDSCYRTSMACLANQRLHLTLCSFSRRSLAFGVSGHERSCWSLRYLASSCSSTMCPYLCICFELLPGRSNCRDFRLRALVDISNSTLNPVCPIGPGLLPSSKLSVL